MEKFEKGEINADSSFEIATQVLTDEIDDSEFLDFAIENLSELLSHIESGRVNIRIHRYARGSCELAVVAAWSTGDLGKRRG